MEVPTKKLVINTPDRDGSASFIDNGQNQNLTADPLVDAQATANLYPSLAKDPVSPTDEDLYKSSISLTKYLGVKDSIEINKSATGVDNSEGILNQSQGQNQNLTADSLVDAQATANLYPSLGKDPVSPTDEDLYKSSISLTKYLGVRNSSEINKSATGIGNSEGIEPASSLTKSYTALAVLKEPGAEMDQYFSINKVNAAMNTDHAQ